MRDRSLIWMLIVATVFTVAASGSVGGLTWTRAHAVERVRQGETEHSRRLAARDTYACIWGRDFDAAKLEDTTRTAAEAVGLRMTGLQMEASPGPQSGQSRILSLEVDATGTFETAMGFLRLAIFDKPSLEVKSLKFTAAGPGLVDFKLEARAECGF